MSSGVTCSWEYRALYAAASWGPQTSRKGRAHFFKTRSHVQRSPKGFYE